MINQIDAFQIGQEYSNDQIRFSLRVENLGGIRPSVDENGFLRHISLMTSTEDGKASRSDNPYHDRIEGEILIYTASGRSGNQQLTGRNKRLLEQYLSPVPIFGFINKGRQIYEFLGLLEIQRHYPEQQIDKTGVLRSVWIFEFKIHKKPVFVKIVDASQIVSAIIQPKEPTSPDTEQEVITTLAPHPVSQQEQIDVESVRSRLFDVNPYRFEHLVKAVIETRGFHKVEVTKSSGDGGVDLNAYVDETDEFFNGTFVQIQAKRWRKSVGSVEINNFRGALHSTAKGIFVTTSYYTKAAIENAYNPMKFCVTLIDGYRIATLIVKSEIPLSNYL